MLIRTLAIASLALAISAREVSVAAAGDKDDPIVAFAKKHLTNPEKPFTLVVMLHIKDGAGEKFEAAFAKARAGTRKEKGNITYDLNRDTEDAKRYVVYERWKSLGDLENHLKADYIVALRKDLGDIAAGPPQLKILLPAAE